MRTETASVVNAEAMAIVEDRAAFVNETPARASRHAPASLETCARPHILARRVARWARRDGR